MHYLDKNVKSLIHQLERPQTGTSKPKAQLPNQAVVKKPITSSKSLSPHKKGHQYEYLFIKK